MKKHRERAKQVKGAGSERVARANTRSESTYEAALHGIHSRENYKFTELEPNNCIICGIHFNPPPVIGFAVSLDGCAACTQAHQHTKRVIHT